VKLKRLHSLGIVHIDIKPANICYSPTLKEFIFIDFGFSRFITEDIGFKTHTNFLGTKGYLSEEM
jgi:serine/threonine protein kinase